MRGHQKMDVIVTEDWCGYWDEELRPAEAPNPRRRALLLKKAG